MKGCLLYIVAFLSLLEFQHPMSSQSFMETQDKEKIITDSKPPQLEAKQTVVVLNYGWILLASPTEWSMCLYFCWGFVLLPAPKCFW